MAKSKHFEFSLDYPDSWQDQSELLLVGPPVDKYSPTMVAVIRKLDQPETPKTFAAKQLPGLRESMGGGKFKLLEEKDNILVAGLPAFLRVYDGVFTTVEDELTQMQVYIIRGLVAHIFTATDTRKNFPNMRPMFEQIIGSVKFDK